MTMDPLTIKLIALVAWAVVYLFYGRAEEEGLGELFPKVLEAPAGEKAE